MISKEKLHLAQLEVYYGQLVNPQSPMYNMGGYVVLTGNLDTALFKSVVASLSMAFDTYNLKYDFTGYEPLLYVGKHEEVFLNEIDFSNELDPEQKAKEWMQQEIDTAFDLKQEKLYKHSLIKIKENLHWWYSYNHHLVYDGFGTALIVNYVTEEYDRRLNNADKPVSNNYPSYFNIAKKSNDYLESQQYIKDANYWKEKFSSIPKPVINYNKKNSKTEGCRFSMHISKSDQALFNRLTKKTKANLSQFTLAALLVYYGKTTDQEVFSFGIPIHNRVSREERKTLGMFSSILPFKGEYKPDKVLLDFISELKQIQRNDYRHRKYPISHLNRSLKLLSENRQQIFDIIINYEPFPFAKSLSSGLHVAIKHMSPITDLEDPLSIRWCDYGEDSSLILNIDFLQEYFEKTEIEEFVERLLFILRQFENGLTNPIQNISILTKKEEDQLLATFNDTKIEFPLDKTIVDLFECQAIKTPNAIAVAYEDTFITYKELDNKSNQLAHYIANNYNGKNDLIGVFIQRNIDLIVSVLGILKSGKTFVPIDTRYPSHRVKHIIQDSTLGFIITDSLSNELLISTENFQRVLLDKDWEAIEKEPFDKLDITTTPNDKAYIIYTSGTTGKPKGVVVNHLGVTNIAFSWKKSFEVDEYTSLLQLASYAFDVFIGDLCKTLLFGGKMVICPDDLRFDLAALHKLIERHRISLIETTPALAIPLMDYIYENNLEYSWIKQVIIGSDVCYMNDFRRLYERFGNSIRITNSYGVTEATIDSSYYEASDVSELSSLPNVPIGKPLHNTRFYVLDTSKNLVPKGVIGELYIGGLGLAKEYLNNSALTQEKFVPNPFKGSDRLYKTGDLARWLPDGDIDFIGRGDSQVKIRGYRIELGEIENELFKHTSISNCCIVTKDDINGNKSLIGYVVSEGNFDKEATESFLKESLPYYMVPTLWVELEKMPLTANGKVDKKNLPEPNETILSSKTFVEPRNEIEKQLVSIWQQLLGIEKIGIYDNFFELGGHSLLVVKLIDQLQKNDYHVTVKDVFSKATIAGIGESLISLKTKYEVPANGIIEDTRYITPSMVPLLNFEQEDIDRIVRNIPSGVSNIQDIYPLSPLQEGIYFQHLINGENLGDPYVTPILLSFNNKEKRASFINAVQFVVNRHDVLRTCFLSKGLPKPVQVVLKKVNLSVEELILDNSKDTLSELKLLTAPGNQWIDLSKTPLLTLQTVNDLENNAFYLILLGHHLVLDHVGIEKITLEVKEYLSGNKNSLPKPALYRNFIGHTLHLQETNDSEFYFKQLLSGIEDPTYPFGLSDIRGNGSTLRDSEIVLPSNINKEIRRVCLELGMSPAVLFHAAFGLLVGKCSNSDYALFGSLFSGRLQGSLQATDSLGLFINTLPFFIKLKGNTLEYVNEVRKKLGELLSYEQTSISSVQGWSDISNDIPFFSAILNFRHTSSPIEKERENDRLIDLGLDFIENQEHSNYPFSIDIDDYGVDFGLKVQVDEEIEADRVIALMQEALVQLLEGLKSKKNIPVNSISILPETEKDQLLNVFNNTHLKLPLDKTIVDFFELQVTKTPNNIAVVFNNTSITYKELDNKSNQLAHYIANNYKTDNNLVGVFIQRNINLIVSVLGILKSGKTYVPIDTRYPSDRIEYIIKDSTLSLIITDSIVNELLVSTENFKRILLDKDDKAIEKEPIDKLSRITTPDDKAYIIYTSGTTGKPKGVVVNYLGLTNIALSWKKVFEVDEHTNLLQIASYAFDVFIGDLCKSLLFGGQMIICPDNLRFDLAALYKLIKRHRISLIETTPALGVPLMDYIYENNLTYSWVKQILLGSDVCHMNDYKRLYERFGNEIRITNSYGLTEATIDSSYYEAKDLTSLSSISNVPIGKPLHNTQFYVLDSAKNLVPKGIIGELYIGGLGLAQEYLNNTELTEERFVSNPFKKEERLYKTGDLARWLPDGNIEFIGRGDNQVKIRGYRIELGEIENVLFKHTYISNCCVITKNDINGNKCLVGYVVPNGELNKDRLREDLKMSLPDYMIPSLWVELKEMPLTANGKLDKRSLPSPNFSELSTKEYVPPRNEIEEKLVTIWQELLGIEKIGIYDQFFELGGHSLLATRFVSMLRKELEVEIAIQNVFIFTTINEIACYLEHKEYNLKYKKKEYSINIEI
ncbi:amino acid adenylation domain-containing protein [Tenacibaculum xiamenense]|uniref:amino acid adenylation domain-containing protein n=1 Tax=Tenacibaculum xiamenense TaxID=1261553 RepID=UPI003894BB5D